MNLPKWTKHLVFIIIGAALISLFEWYGFWGFIVFLFVVLTYHMWKGRESIRMAMWNAETTIWGKPLEKTFWKEGEFKDHKVKFVWKKKQKSQ